jgi:hypothetical protein
MTDKSALPVHRPRVQTPEQEAAEQAIRKRFQEEKPSLQDLVASGDVTQVLSMGEYWTLRNGPRQDRPRPLR